ncbi:MAG TPA: hypothetical protein VEB21_01300, partial [Terriglobales bacterium]|nr:hypothetical protein [Terriglobales bacterium]
MGTPRALLPYDGCSDWRSSIPASSGEDVTYAYDDTTGGNYGVGRLTSVADESGSATSRYDARGNMVETTQTTASQSYTTSYAYDLADNVVAIEYPSGMLVEITRDASGRIEEITAQADPLSPVETIVEEVAYLPFSPSTIFGAADIQTSLAS